MLFQKITKQGITEWLVFIGIFSGILFPLRYIFTTYFSHYWLGSVGIISIVTISLYYLSTKGKLGRIGIIIKKRLEKRSKGKLGVSIMIFLSIMIYIEGLIVFGILYADQEQVKTITQQLNKLGVHDINSAIKLPTHGLTLSSYLEELFILLTPNELSFTILHVINNLSNNFILPIFSILLVEDIEILGLIIFFRYKPKSM